ncbi:hypothetical protein LBMAG56_53230 [Verrucomicrobiota bacterium]|nr:hypothetical protein LBMAG56_53230 [Verrucomicrobiota bacterium]
MKLGSETPLRGSNVLNSDFVNPAPDRRRRPGRAAGLCHGVAALATRLLRGALALAAVVFGGVCVTAQPRLAISSQIGETSRSLSYPASPAVYTVEYAADLATGPWQLLGTANPLVIDSRGPAGFFRLRKLSDFPRLDRNNLLAWRDPAGVVQPAADVASWLNRRAAILAGMQAVMGALPDVSKRVDPDLQIIEDWNLGTYRRQLVTYLAEQASGFRRICSFPTSRRRPEENFPPCCACTKPIISKAPQWWSIWGAA